MSKPQKKRPKQPRCRKKLPATSLNGPPNNIKSPLHNNTARLVAAMAFHRNSCGSRGAVSANKNVVALPSVYLGNQSFLALRKIINNEINDSAVMVNNRFIRTFVFEKIS